MIPIYINVFNRLTTTKRLAAQCSAIPGSHVIIVDNNSNWDPLIAWYEKECQFSIIRLGENRGHHAPWSVIDPDDEFIERWGQDKYIVTDCDIDIGDVPSDIFEMLAIPFSWPAANVIKSGLSLRIDDLPEWQEVIMSWELQFWKKKFRNDDRFYAAPIDTTFAMYSCKTPFHIAKTTSVVCARAATPYTARHIPWYLDSQNLDEENANYFKTSGPSNSWKPLKNSKSLGH